MMRSSSLIDVEQFLDLHSVDHENFYKSGWKIISFLHVFHIV